MKDDRSQFRSVTHGTCTLGGKHTPGSDMERECPLNRERIARRSERGRKAGASRRLVNAFDRNAVRT